MTRLRIQVQAQQSGDMLCKETQNMSVSDTRGIDACPVSQGFHAHAG